MPKQPYAVCASLPVLMEGEIRQNETPVLSIIVTGVGRYYL